MIYYFYYFQDTQTNLYYGGITNNVYKRQYRHQGQLNKNLKSDKKPWHLYQDKIQLIVLWSFETKSQACAYEKQWIINNYLNPLCLNCSVSNSEYEFKNHLSDCFKNLTKEEYIKHCESKGGHKAKSNFAIDLITNVIYTFNSNSAAEKHTGVPHNKISKLCKLKKSWPGNKTRWAFANSKAELLLKASDLNHN